MIKCNTKYYDSFYRKNIRYYLISETDNSLWALTVAVFDYVSILTKISMLFNNNYNINGLRVPKWPEEGARGITANILAYLELQ